MLKIYRKKFPCELFGFQDGRINCLNNEERIKKCWLAGRQTDVQKSFCPVCHVCPNGQMDRWTYRTGEQTNKVASNSLKLPSVSLIEYLTEYYKQSIVNKQLFVCIRWQRIQIPINQQIFEVDRILMNSTISVKKWDRTICNFS